MKKIFLVFLLTINSSSFAAFVYITDEVDIPIRSSKSFNDNIMRSAPSGAKLKILKTDSDGWTKIKLESTTGWVISRYLTNNPPARIELQKLKINNSANKILLKKQSLSIKRLEDDLQNLGKKNATNKISALKANAEKRHIEKTYQESLKIIYENDRLTQKNLNLQSEIALLKISNKSQIENTNRTWFLYGGILALIGIILGFIVSRIGKR